MAERKRLKEKRQIKRILEEEGRDLAEDEGLEMM
jgi:hypothetical protein